MASVIVTHTVLSIMKDHKMKIVDVRPWDECLLLVKLDAESYGIGHFDLVIQFKLKKDEDV